MGLGGALFTLLDQETEPGLRRSIQEVLIHMMASSSTSGQLGHWLKLCKDVVSASSGGWSAQLSAVWRLTFDPHSPQAVGSPGR